jgi:hypothetical protein
MRKHLPLCLLPAFFLVQAHAATPAANTASDEAAIRAIIAADDAGRPDPHVAPQMDWENAFGVRYTDAAGRDRLLHYVATKLQAHATSEVLETRIAVLDPAMAVADEYWHVVGQIVQETNKPGADRWGRTTYILRKQPAGWSLVAERIADLRAPYYHHYSALPQSVAVPPAILASYAGTYLTSDGKIDSHVSVAGDHLLVQVNDTTEIGIATSANDFLVFAQNDLERYYNLHFENGGTKLVWSADHGRRGGTAVKAPLKG